MTEIASREFIDNLTSLINGFGGILTDEAVKNRILGLIQTWAIAAEGRYNLVYISETYKSLQRDGLRFPPKEDVASTMFDSNAVRSSNPCPTPKSTNTPLSLPNGQTPMSA